MKVVSLPERFDPLPEEIGTPQKVVNSKPENVDKLPKNPCRLPQDLDLDHETLQNVLKNLDLDEFEEALSDLDEEGLDIVIKGLGKAVDKVVVVPEDYDSNAGEQTSVPIIEAGPEGYRSHWFDQFRGSPIPDPDPIPKPGSREEAERYLRKARVTLTGKLDYRHPLMSHITMDGTLVEQEPLSPSPQGDEPDILLRLKQACNRPKEQRQRKRVNGSP
jgi:hypothetical protein